MCKVVETTKETPEPSGPTSPPGPTIPTGPTPPPGPTPEPPIWSTSPGYDKSRFMLHIIHSHSIRSIRNLTTVIVYDHVYFNF